MLHFNPTKTILRNFHNKEIYCIRHFSPFLVSGTTSIVDWVVTALLPEFSLSFALLFLVLRRNSPKIPLCKAGTFLRISLPDLAESRRWPEKNKNWLKIEYGMFTFWCKNVQCHTTKFNWNFLTYKTTVTEKTQTDARF